jgi:peptidoglycan/xylan/chitin deacetylase (PgdA/CDA1 family)
MVEWRCITSVLIRLGVVLLLFHACFHPSARAQNRARTVAITVDDLPGAIPRTGSLAAVGDLKELQRINSVIPNILKAHHAPAVGFVIEAKLQVPGQRDARIALLQHWLDGGFALGNHTYTHTPAQNMTLQQYEEGTIRGEVVTRSLMQAAGQQEKYFRHPGLMTGPTPEYRASFEAFLKAHGYLIAPVTIDNDDWEFNDVLGDALERGDDALVEKTKDAYLAHTEEAFDYYEGVSRSLFQREIPQVLLIHDSELTAECLDAVLTNLEKRGYRFISLDDALADQAYQTPDLYVGTVGFSWLGRWKLAFGQRAALPGAPDAPEWITKMSDDIRRAKLPR